VGAGRMLRSSKAQRQLLRRGRRLQSQSACVETLFSPRLPDADVIGNGSVPRATVSAARRSASFRATKAQVYDVANKDLRRSDRGVRNGSWAQPLDTHTPAGIPR